MAKELPYFQFEPAEYLAGNISFCSLESQGVFTLMCCYYWQRSCSLTKSQFLKRVNKPKELQELIDEEVILIDKDNNITISFLFEQFNGIVESKNNSSEKGKIGNLKRWHKDIYSKFIKKEISLAEALAIAKVSPPDDLAIAETSHIREDNIILDKIIEENKREVLNSQSWIESICIQKKLQKERVELYLNTFLDDLQLKDELDKDIKEIKSHFVNWLNIQMKDIKESKSSWGINEY